jgi:hypothetical protein
MLLQTYWSSNARDLRVGSNLRMMAIEILTHTSGQIQAPTGAPVSQVSPCFISTALHASNQLLTSVGIRHFQPKLFWVVSWQLQSIWLGRRIEFCGGILLCHRIADCFLKVHRRSCNKSLVLFSICNAHLYTHFGPIVYFFIQSLRASHR